jgi:hypothetical protein
VPTECSPDCELAGHLKSHLPVQALLYSLTVTLAATCRQRLICLKEVIHSAHREFEGQLLEFEEFHRDCPPGNRRSHHILLQWNSAQLNEA